MSELVTNHYSDSVASLPAGDRVTTDVSGPAANGATAAISVPRDLAVQVVGSDAGRQRRMKPHSAMTKGATPQEIRAVEEFMRPFLEQEIERVYNKTGHSAASHAGLATVEQATALKGFCLRCAESLKQHLAKKGADDRHHRSKQRLDQARAVVAQINAALGTPADDGGSSEERVEEIVGGAVQLRDQLREFLERHARTSREGCAQDLRAAPVAALKAFLVPLNAFVEGCERRRQVASS
jgi:hypothetical protein